MLQSIKIPARAGEASRLVIFLHGYSSNGADFIDFAAHFAQLDPHADFILPNGQEPSPFLPNGYQWFPIPEYGHGTQKEAELSLLRATHEINTLIDDELSLRGLDARALCLVGFSQGSMMALHVALRRETPIGAAIGFSGKLLAPERLASESRSKPPIKLVHGEEDEVVLANESIEAGRILRDFGVDVSVSLFPGLAHSISEEALQSALTFYNKAFLLPQHKNQDHSSIHSH